MAPAERFRRFAALHVPGDPLILYNVWDAGSARAVAEAGARAIATGSWSVAAAQGHGDREQLPLELALANAARIVAAVELPVTIDFEGGYAEKPQGVADNVARLAETGAIGCNFEDQMIGGEGLHPIPAQVGRIRSAREAAGPCFFINARTDIFLKAKPDAHGRAAVAEALERGRAYAEAGANGLFVPGLVDEALIAAICAGSPLPVNVMAFPGTPPTARLAAAGVARISFAGGPYRVAMKALKEAAAAAFGAGS
jgi:2-methylisocitrate lyase-like PEP mutase family enzyme